MNKLKRLFELAVPDEGTNIIKMEDYVFYEAKEEFKRFYSHLYSNLSDGEEIEITISQVELSFRETGKEPELLVLGSNEFKKLTEIDQIKYGKDGIMNYDGVEVALVNTYSCIRFY